MIWFFINVSIIILVELLSSFIKPRKEVVTVGRSNNYWVLTFLIHRISTDRFSISWLLVEMYRFAGFCLFGAIATNAFTDMSKFTIGRLRPHFLTICKPDFGRRNMSFPYFVNTTCECENGYLKFVEIENCPGVNQTLSKDSETVITEKVDINRRH